jgi:hypothetical protein
VSHRLPLSQVPEAYRMWNDKTDDCTKIVLTPEACSSQWAGRPRIFEP